MADITYDDFDKIDMRVGVIREVALNEKARKPAYKVRVDFGGAIGEKWSSAQITQYAADSLIGRHVVAVVNFPPKNIAGFISQILILGVPDAEGNVILLEPERDVPLGGRVF